MRISYVHASEPNKVKVYDTVLALENNPFIQKSQEEFDAAEMEHFKKDVKEGKILHYEVIGESKTWDPMYLDELLSYLENRFAFNEWEPHGKHEELFDKLIDDMEAAMNSTSDYEVGAQEATDNFLDEVKAAVSDGKRVIALRNDLYETYKKEWLKKHVSPSDWDAVESAYEKSEGHYGSYEEFYEEIGFANGEIYSYADFLDNEYQDVKWLSKYLSEDGLAFLIENDSDLIFAKAKELENILSSCCYFEVRDPVYNQYEGDDTVNGWIRSDGKGNNACCIEYSIETTDTVYDGLFQRAGIGHLEGQNYNSFDDVKKDYPNAELEAYITVFEDHSVFFAITLKDGFGKNGDISVENIPLSEGEAKAVIVLIDKDLRSIGQTYTLEENLQEARRFAENDKKNKDLQNSSR